MDQDIMTSSIHSTFKVLKLLIGPINRISKNIIPSFVLETFLNFSNKKIIYEEAVDILDKFI